MPPLMPRWMLRNIVYSHSVNLPKMEKFIPIEDRCGKCLVPIKGKSQHWQQSLDKWVCPQCYVAPKYEKSPAWWDSIDRRPPHVGGSFVDTVSGLMEFDGNLGHTMYRYYIGARSKKSNYMKCRVCGEVFYKGFDIVTLKAHKDKLLPSCFKRLDKALELIRVIKSCIVCGKPQWNEKWGVLLCPQGDCISTWMFDGSKDYHRIYGAMLRARESWWKNATVATDSHDACEGV